MKLDEPTWKAVIDAALANIDRRNQYFKEAAPYNRLTLDVLRDGERCQMIITKWVIDRSGGFGGYGHERVQQYRAVARRSATGELCKGKPLKKGNWDMWSTDGDGAKAWEKLAGKSPAEIVDGLKLTDFGPVFIGGSDASAAPQIGGRSL